MDDYYTPARMLAAAVKGLMYALPALVAFLNWDRVRELFPRSTYTRRLWLATAIILACLAVATWLQLPHLAEDLGRGMLRAAGLYLNRRPLQAVVIGIIALATFILCIRFLTWPGAPLPLKLVFIGAVGITAEVVIIALSFHYIDVVLGKNVLPGLRVSAGLTISGVVWIWFWAAVASRDLFQRSGRADRTRGR